MRVIDQILICIKTKNSHFLKTKRWELLFMEQKQIDWKKSKCEKYSVNVTKKSVEKRVSMLTHRELSIAKNKLKIQII